jgi:pilus assembly protein CpaB
LIKEIPLMKNGKINRTIIGVICIILGLVICFAIAPLVNNKMAEKAEIIRVNKDIPQGSIISDKDVVSISVGSFNLPEGVIKDKSQVIGKYAACDLRKDSYVLSSMISPTGDSAADIFKSLTDTQRAMSIPITDFANGLSGKLQNGDIVSIIITSESKTLIPGELKYIRVITTTTATGNDADQKDNSKSEQQPETVTLLVNEIQAKLLAHYEINGKIHITLVYRGNDNNSKLLLDKQNEYFLNSDNSSANSDIIDNSSKYTASEGDVSNG